MVKQPRFQLWNTHTGLQVSIIYAVQILKRLSCYGPWAWRCKLCSSNRIQYATLSIFAHDGEACARTRLLRGGTASRFHPLQSCRLILARSVPGAWRQGARTVLRIRVYATIRAVCNDSTQLITDHAGGNDMGYEASSADALRTFFAKHDVHTVETAVADSQGHLRGKRVPVERFLRVVVDNGVNIADAIFVFDMQNDLPENEFINMDTGYLDCTLVPDNSSARILTHRPGYAVVFCDTFDAQGNPHVMAPRNVLAKQVERCRALGLDPVIATEMEFILCTPDWQPVTGYIQYSSLTDMLDLEDVLRDMRDSLAGAGIEVESSNAEYGPGQVEINCGHGGAMKIADDTVLFKSIVKQVAMQHGLRATFMAKPFTEATGNGMHVHSSLRANGKNAFADCAHQPNALMGKWLAGLLDHALAMTFIGAPTPNGPRRIRPYTFAPTHVCWGLDNRTVLARCIAEPDSQANRVEFRAAGADANPYLVIAAILAAGADGIERDLTPPQMSSGDKYTHPGDCAALPTTLADAVEYFRGSALAGMLGEVFAKSYVSIADAEVALAAEHAPDPDEVNDWERERFIVHS